MIPDGEKWYYLSVKTLSVLLQSVTLKHNGDFHCWYCFGSFRTEFTLKLRENVCKIFDCFENMSEIFADTETSFEDIDTCQGNPGRSSTTREREKISY